MKDIVHEAQGIIRDHTAAYMPARKGNETFHKGNMR